MNNIVSVDRQNRYNVDRCIMGQPGWLEHLPLKQGEKCQWQFARPERDGARHAERYFSAEKYLWGRGSISLLIIIIYNLTYVGQ